MDTSDWLYRNFPFLFPKKVQNEKSKLEKMLQQRFKVVTDKLKVQNILTPKLKLSFRNSQYSNNTVYFNYSKIFATQEHQTLVFDHELAHHIQHCINKNIKKYYPPEILSFFYARAIHNPKHMHG